MTTVIVARPVRSVLSNVKHFGGSSGGGKTGGGKPPIGQTGGPRIPPVASSTSGTRTPNTGAHPKMKIVAEGVKPFVVPYAPVTTTADGVVPEWSTVQRGGREPLLLRAGGSLETVQFDLIIGYPDPTVSVQPLLTALDAIAASGARIRMDFDARCGRKMWRLTSYSEQVIARQHGTNAPTRAVCQMTFTEVSDPVKAVGPTSGGSGGGGGGKNGPPGMSDAKRPKSYVWKKGDTWPKVTKRFYGRADLWQELADHNKIKAPKKIKPGKKIKLPRRAVLGDVRTVSVLSNVTTV